MKKYVAPTLSCVELRLEERISACTGSCTEEDLKRYGNPYNLVAYNAGS